MSITPPPCKDCSYRYIGCHSGCMTWQNWKAEEDTRKAELNKAKAIEQDFRSAQAEKSNRFRRKSHNDNMRGRHPW
nr:hypothetical protein [uncultured Caproiciproducens sp.]